MSLENSVYGLLRYLGDVQQGVNWSDGNVPTWNETTGQFEPVTPSGGGGSVNTIYNSNDIITSNRVVSMANFDLNFNGNDGFVKIENAGKGLRIEDNTDDYSFLKIQGGGSPSGVVLFGVTGSNYRADYRNNTILTGKYNHGPLKIVNTGLSNNAEIWFNIGNGGTSDGTASKRKMLIDNNNITINNAGLIVNSTSKVGSEITLLRGNTLIKGAGSTTGTGLEITNSLAEF
jgi:hypothetical protein